MDAAGRDDKATRYFGRSVIIMLVVAFAVLSVTTKAFASGPLSSIVLSETEPGLVAAAPGPFNGTLTPSNLDVITGSSGPGENALAQDLTGGNLSAYVRTWIHQPADGDAVVITAYQFAHALDESTFLAGVDNSMQDRAGAVAFAAPGIPGAIGSETHASTSGTNLTEYAVVFQRGNLVFQVEVASSSGDLTSADAVSVASQQFAAAPDTPAGPGTTDLNGLRDVLLVVGLVLIVTMVVVGRTRKYPHALTGHPLGMPTAPAPPGPWAAASTPTEGLTAPPLSQVGAGPWG